jgi:hypothetical protein
MRYSIQLADGYLRAEMHGRENAEETRQFVAAILEGVRSHKATRVLISIRESRALFKVEDWKFSEALEEALRIARLKVAFIADSKDVSMSQEYIALIGRQKGFDFQAFGSETEAVAWLKA